MSYKFFHYQKLITSIFAAVIVLFVISCAKDVLDLHGTIKGVVKDYNTGLIISNCQVALSPGGKSVVTSSDGLFEFTGLEQGSYTLSFTKAGYDNESKSVEVVSGETTEVSITLKAKSPFAVSNNKLDFGDLSSTMELFFFNNSDETTSFTISNVPAWASVSHVSGSVASAGNMPITVSVNRDAVDYGTYTQVLSIAYKGKTNGSVNVTIQMQKVHLTAPDVRIGAVAENITQNGFTIEGELVATGGAEVISYGHCWGLTSNPTIDNYKQDNGATTSIGRFITTVTDLTPGTSYYVRAYATNQYGTAYSQEIVVTTQDVASNKWDGNIATKFARGSGTSTNPYIIETGGQLLLMKDYKNKCFELANNIDLDNKNWLPFEFSGKLDGKGCIISNLRISRETDEQGLFSLLSGTVQNLTIRNINIDSPDKSKIGALAGHINADVKSISNCHVILTENSKIVGNNMVGGLIGCVEIPQYNSSSRPQISNCSVSANTQDIMIMGNECVGGLIGGTDTHSDGIITVANCCVNISVGGDKYIGGIIGYMYSYNKTVMENSFYEGSLVGEIYVGGLVGCGTNYHVSNRGSYSIKSCCARSSIACDEFGGGLLGYSNYGSCQILASYAVVDFQNGGSKFGGFIGGLREMRTAVLSCCYSVLQGGCDNLGFIGYNNTGSYAKLYDCFSTASSLLPSSYYINTDNCEGGCMDYGLITKLQDSFSSYLNLWNFSNTFTVKAATSSGQQDVVCPRLSWEE